MSFAATVEAVRSKTKCVTRRLGWTFLRPGDRVMAVVKSRGVSVRDRIELGVIEVVETGREPLECITTDEVHDEGFPGKSRGWFIESFCRLNGCSEEVDVTRIKFRYVSDLPEGWPPGRFRTVLADPPWRFDNRTGKAAPEHARLTRYRTMSLKAIQRLPVQGSLQDTAHLYLWVPNALLPQGLEVMRAWGFRYKTNLIWYKVRKDGGPDGRGVGHYFRNVTEVLLFGIYGSHARTLQPGRRQVNLLSTRKREHSRKPYEFHDLIEKCSPGPRVELFARERRHGWIQWGDEVDW